MAQAGAVVFDVDDTLYDLAAPYRAAYAAVFADEYDLPVDDLFRVSRVHSDEALELLSAGRITPEDHVVYRVQRTFADWGVEVGRARALEFQRAYAAAQERIEMFPEAAEALDACVAAGVGLGVISNGDSAHQRAKMARLGLGRWVGEGRVIVSADLGAPKPAQVLYEAMEARLGLSGAQIWYVGDTYESDVVGAKRAGWSCLWLDVRGRPAPEVPERPDLVAHSVAEMRDMVAALVQA